MKFMSRPKAARQSQRLRTGTDSELLYTAFDLFSRFQVLQFDPLLVLIGFIGGLLHIVCRFALLAVVSCRTVRTTTLWTRYLLLSGTRPSGRMPEARSKDWAAISV